MVPNINQEFSFFIFLILSVFVQSDSEKQAYMGDLTNANDTNQNFTRLSPRAVNSITGLPQTSVIIY